jgi:hypothetical protein
MTITREELDELQKLTRGWKRASDMNLKFIEAVTNKVISHRTYNYHEGCCMSMIENILLDFGLLDPRKEAEE